MTVIQFSDYSPHLSGKIKCLHCGHTWIGVCPIDEEKGVPAMECPSCHLFHGFYIYPILPNEGEEIYKCNCGGELFFIIKGRGHRCILCGVLHDIKAAD